MSKIKFKIYTLGCKVNQYDGNDLVAKLTAAGFTMVKNGADLAIINTCAVTKTALAKDRQMVARARKENPGAKIIITGCAPKVYKEEMAELGADLVVAERETETILEKITNYKLQITNKFPNFKSQISRGDINLVRSDKSRYFIKIQDGCKQFCTYCIIPYVRGDLRSRQAEEVIQEVEGAVASGYREIVLCGIHLGLYGADFHSLSFARRGQGEVNYGEKKRQTSPQPSPYKGEGANAEFRNYDLASLLLELINIPQLGRIRLSSIEVNEVTDELIDLIKTSGKICRHLHIPLQSGNDKILKLMNRPYTTKIFASRKNKIKRAVPDIAISTDVIVGFPGESASDFDKTVAFIKKMKFSKVHVFPFSAHERTPAAKMPDQVSVQIRLARSKRLNGLSAKLEREYQTRFKGKKLACIIDGRSKDGRYRAKTEFHFAIEFSSSKKFFPGDLVEVKNWCLLGREI